MKKNSILSALLFLFLLGFAAKSNGQTYCNSNFTNVTYEYVKNVTYAGINNTTSGTVGGPVNYTALGPANVTVGTANNLSVTIQADFNEYVFAFIDWNHNGTLNDAGEVYTIASGVGTAGPFTVSVTPPPASYIGTTRMRVMLAYGNATPNPCLTNNVYGEAEDYTVNVQAAVNCSAVTFPASASVGTTPSSICVSGNVTLNMTTATAMPAASGITYKWQSSTAAGGPFTDIPGAVTTVPTYTTTTPITTTTYYKCVVLCNTTTTVLTSAASPAVVVANPGTVTPTPASRCGPGSVTLSATPSISTNTIAWYANPTGGLALATGNSFTTPSLPVTTTYYVDAEMQGAPLAATVGTGTVVNGTTTYPTPYGQYYGAAHDQYLIRASELYAAGFSAGNFTSIAFDLAQGYTGAVLQNYQVLMANTSVTALTAGNLITTGFTPVIPTMATYTPPGVAGFAATPFTTPFVWDGVSNVVVDVSFSNCSVCNGTSNCTTSYTVNGVVRQTSTAFTSSQSYHYDGNCTINTMAIQNFYVDEVFSQRPNMKFETQPICASPRQAIVATITPGPAINIAKPAVVCSGEIANFVVSSTPMSNYTTYAWTPNVADLYTNAGATTPYVSGSAPNAYFKSTVNGAHTYYLFSSGATAAACTHADTFSVWVQPDSISIKGTPDSICVSGTSILSLVPETGYATNSVQWQESSNGTTYANITGATNTSYTTPTLTTNHYYRALVKSTNDTCEMPVKYIVVVNPQLLGASDSFNCGPGTVTLQAQTGGNSTAKWYDVPSGGAAVGSGTPWITPSLNASQTYYVSAEGGAGGGAPVTVTVGTGTTANATTDYPTPFGNYYGSSHDQYLILASELTSQGASPGNITSIAFYLNNAYSYATLKNFEIKMANTSVTALNTTFISTGMTVVRPAANYTPPTTTGFNVIPFANNFVWTGGNVVVDVSFTNCSTCNNTNSCVTSYTNNGRVRQTTTSFVSAHTAYDDNNCSVSSMTPSGIFLSNTTFSKRPNMRFGAQAPCQTPRQAVHAYIYPKPAVDLGQDINMCVDGGTSIVLDAGVQPNTPAFLWDDNSTSQVRAVNSSGTYNIKVTNSYTCVGGDTINVVLRKNPVVHLGNDTTVCNGVVLTLNPGGGSIEYFWNTGQTGQTINVNSAGIYSVFVTNAEGCVSTDTIQVTMQGELPTIGGIQVSNDGINNFHFTAVYPQNVIGYDWDFGDGSLHSYEASPTHQYDSTGDFIVVLRLSSTCGFASDTIGAHIVGIHQINVNNDELTVYPNPSNGQATILNKGDLKMEKVEVYSILGQVVYRSKADSKDKHVINLSNIASGVYTIEVYTDKGTVARKLEIIR